MMSSQDIIFAAGDELRQGMEAQIRTRLGLFFLMVASPCN
jgi:hypothetical protein